MSLLDWWRGSGRHSVSVPAMDGALKPNDLVEQASVLAEADGADNLACARGALWFSSGSQLLRIALPHAGRPAERAEDFGRDILAVASDGGDALAVAFDDGILISGGRHDGRRIAGIDGRLQAATTSCMFETPDVVLLCLGSQRHPASRWKHDLLSHEASGSVWRVDIATGTYERLAERLAFPAGIARTAAGEILVAEAWRHRVIELSTGRPVLDDLPFYPGRMAVGANGEILLSGFAPRRQMVEFILREPEFCKRMTTEIAEDHWMAPSLSSGKDFLEPLQGGEIKHHGILKPWAPTKSYGLVVRFDRTGRIVNSMHSRAGGRRHGITAALEQDGHVIMTSKGSGAVLAAAMVSGGING